MAVIGRRTFKGGTELIRVYKEHHSIFPYVLPGLPTTTQLTQLAGQPAGRTLGGGGCLPPPPPLLDCFQFSKYWNASSS